MGAKVGHVPLCITCLLCREHKLNHSSGKTPCDLKSTGLLVLIILRANVKYLLCELSVIPVGNTITNWHILKLLCTNLLGHKVTGAEFLGHHIVGQKVVGHEVTGAHSREAYRRGAGGHWGTSSWGTMLWGMWSLGHNFWGTKFWGRTTGIEKCFK